MDYDYQFDVAVVGGGACGLMAALRTARSRSLSIVIFEKNTRLMSNAQISGGTLAAAGTRFQHEAGIEDSPQTHAADIQRKNHGRSDPQIVLALCETAPKYIEWLADELQYPLELATDMTRVGHSRPRLHTDRARAGGSALVRALHGAVEAASNIVFADCSPAIGLITRDGTVLGLTIDEGGQPRRVRAGAVVLASGGFGGNAGMVARYCPEISGCAYIGTEGNTGEAIAWAGKLGAEMVNMGAYQAHGHAVPGYGTRLNPGIPLAGGIVVNLAGRRFANEDQGYSEFARHVLAQPGGCAVEIWDQRIMSLVRNSEQMRDSAAAGAYLRFERLEDLAGSFGLPMAILQETVELCLRTPDGVADGLGRVWRGERLQPPLFAARITGALAHTQGGPRTDSMGRVLDSGGDILGNLYAGGGAAVGISGDSSDGYLSGNGLLSAFGFGYRIGDHLAGAND